MLTLAIFLKSMTRLKIQQTTEVISCWSSSLWAVINIPIELFRKYDDSTVPLVWLLFVYMKADPLVVSSWYRLAANAGFPQSSAILMSAGWPQQSAFLVTSRLLGWLLLYVWLFLLYSCPRDLLIGLGQYIYSRVVPLRSDTKESNAMTVFLTCN